MNELSRTYNIKDSVLKENQKTDTIEHCLTDECKDCIGSYINRAFGHRLICKCECHNLNNEKAGYTAKITSF
jgi:hypothetical protein